MTFKDSKPTLMRKIYSFLFLLFSLSFVGHSQYVTQGDAYLINPPNEYRLTWPWFGQSGQVWYQNKINLSSNFKVEAELNFGDRDGLYDPINNLADPGADGIGFVLQNMSTGVGGTGGQLGYGGIAPSFITEFDTYQNPEVGDPVP